MKHYIFDFRKSVKRGYFLDFRLNSDSDPFFSETYSPSNPTKLLAMDKDFWLFPKRIYLFWKEKHQSFEQNQNLRHFFSSSSNHPNFLVSPLKVWLFLVCLLFGYFKKEDLISIHELLLWQITSDLFYQKIAWKEMIIEQKVQN